jgi:hypothetical protein
MTTSADKIGHQVRCFLLGHGYSVVCAANWIISPPDGVRGAGAAGAMLVCWQRAGC